MNTYLFTYAIAWTAIGFFVVRLAMRQRQLQDEASAMVNESQDAHP